MYVIVRSDLFLLMFNCWYLICKYIVFILMIDYILVYKDCYSFIVVNNLEIICLFLIC